MIYLISLVIFSALIFLLVGMLLLLEGSIVKTDDIQIMVNDDKDKSLTVKSGTTLLSALVGNGILLPSACGGKGSCGTCKCKVVKGGGNYLPTELTHLNRKEKSENIRIACQVKVKNDISIRLPQEIFSIQKFEATVVSNQNVATFIKELVLKLDNNQELEFIAGAYIQIDIPEYDASFKDFDVPQRYRASWEHFNLWNLKAHSDAPVYRAYSLANPPSEKTDLVFTIRIATPPPGRDDIPPGVGSSYVFNLKPGEKVTLSGPYGEFFVKDTKREMCFIGGGAGMAPMRCHILNQLRDLNTDRRVTFWYGARSSQEMFYDDLFKQLEAEHGNFSYHVALSDPQPEDNWTGLTGFIHHALYNHYLKDHDDPTEIEFYLCGPPPMIDAVNNMLDQLGVEPDMIAYDKFS